MPEDVLKESRGDGELSFIFKESDTLIFKHSDFVASVVAVGGCMKEPCILIA